MEIEMGSGPVIIAFCTMSICLPSVSHDYSRTEGKPAVIHTSGTTSSLKFLSPMALVVGTAFFIMLGQAYYDRLWSTVLIVSYAAFLIGIISALILPSRFQKVSISFVGGTRRIVVFIPSKFV